MIYLDAAATTKPSKNVLEAAIKAGEFFGNPSSLHRLGMESEKLIEESRDIIAKKLCVDKKNIYFTSGGTEANNTAILGFAHANKRIGNHVITTKIEHPSVLESFKRLEEEGFEVTYLDVDENCVINIEELTKALRDDTILVSIMHVNNETGMIQPIEKIKNIIKEKSKRAVFHVDAVQSFCKIPCLPEKWGVDMMSVSSHKIHGLKGTGALYIKNPKIKSIILGGEQQKGLRPGTENVAGILGFGTAVKDSLENDEKIHKLRDRLKNGIIENIDNVKINGNDLFSSGNILNVSFIGVKAEILLHALEMHEIYVSTGSACSSHKPQPSHVLTAMGLSKKEIEGAIRFSFDEEITQEDIDTTINALKKEVLTIRKYVR